MEYQFSSHIVSDRILAGLTVKTPRQARKSSGLEFSSGKRSLLCNLLSDRLIRNLAGLIALTLAAITGGEKRSLSYF